MAPVAIEVWSIGGQQLLHTTLEPDETPELIVQSLEEQTGTPAKYQRLLFNEHTLSRCASLTSQGLSSDASLSFIAVTPEPEELDMSRFVRPGMDACLARYLLRSRADPRQRLALLHGADVPLLRAAARGDLVCTAVLLESRADPNEAADLGFMGRGDSPLLAAVSSDREAVLRAILEARADHTQSVDGMGDFPLLRAARRGKEAIVRTLLEGKADPMQVSSTSSSFPLWEAARWGHEACVRALLEARADAQQETIRRDRSSALDVASESGQAACIRALLEARALQEEVRTMGCEEEEEFPWEALRCSLDV